ncbi:MAG: DUF411 domain-containing protein [Acidimicrobiia bacterium]
MSDDADRTEFREALGIPEGVASCHTAVVEGYAIEGHVPVGALVRLREERPEAVGLALPGMPADSPGMGGDATTWERQPVLLVDHAGAATRFEY